MKRNSKSVKPELPAGFIRGGRRSQSFIDEIGLSADSTFPRNSAAYTAIAEAFPGFSFRTGERAVGNSVRRFVHFDNYPRHLGDHPSLATLLLEAQRDSDGKPIFIPDAFPPEVARKAAILRDLIGGIADEFVGMLMLLPAIMPPSKIVRALAGWIKEAREGKPLTIFSAVCPPYSYRETGDPKRPYEYTFDGLHEGVGIVAKNVLNAIGPTSEFFRKQGWDVRFLVAMADFEGDSSETLKRVGLSHSEFIERLHGSQQAFLEQCPADANVETCMVKDLFGPDNWNKAMGMAQSAIDGGNFGAFKMSKSDLEAICAARESLIRRWHGDSCDVEGKVLTQAREYMALGHLASEHLDNTLILGGDSVAMAGFLQGLASPHEPLPTIYLRSKHY